MISGEFVVSKSIYNNVSDAEVLVNLCFPFLPRGKTIISPVLTFILSSSVSTIPSPFIIKTFRIIRVVMLRKSR